MYWQAACCIRFLVFRSQFIRYLEPILGKGEGFENDLATQIKKNNLSFSKSIKITRISLIEIVIVIAINLFLYFNNYGQYKLGFDFDSSFNRRFYFRKISQTCS